MAETLVVNEVYLSLQGESTFAGLPCVFVRLTGCPLRCSYCDTAYAFTEGCRWRREELEAEIERHARSYADTLPGGDAPAGERGADGSASPGVASGAGPRLPLVELTGGEPLAQPAVLPLMRGLCDAGFTVLLETSGALDIAAVDGRVHRIMDLKCPSSGEAGRNRWENLAHLMPTDEVKFVIATVEDYDWARGVVGRHRLERVCPVLFSWVAPLTRSQRVPSLKSGPSGESPLTRRELAERILADALPVRFQLQMHKLIWPPDQRGV
jgi:7-carboxy-7-deazaguanine synthase